MKQPKYLKIPLERLHLFWKLQDENRELNKEVERLKQKERKDGDNGHLPDRSKNL